MRMDYMNGTVRLVLLCVITVFLCVWNQPWAAAGDTGERIQKGYYANGSQAGTPSDAEHLDMQETEGGMDAEIELATDSDADMDMVLENDLVPLSANSLEYDWISDGEELKAWINKHTRTGGYAKFENDIVLTGEYDTGFVRRGSPDVVLDTGEYSLVIEGIMYSVGMDNLVICGSGKDQAVIRVEEEGQLYLDFTRVMATDSNGCAIYQEEGSILSLDGNYNKNQITGSVQYSGVACGVPFSESSLGSCVIEADMKVEDWGFPQEILVSVYPNNGDPVERQNYPVSWDFETAEADRKEQSRTVLTGEILSEGLRVLNSPGYLLYFKKSQAVITTVNKRTYNQDPAMILDFQVYADPIPVSMVVLWSADEENWQEGNVYEPCSLVTHVIQEFQYDQPYFICIKLENSDGTAYSNVIKADGDTVEDAKDYDGGRGGGNDIIDNPMPPIVDETTAPLPSFPVVIPDTSQPETEPSTEAGQPAEEETKKEPEQKPEQTDRNSGSFEGGTGYSQSHKDTTSKLPEASLISYEVPKAGPQPAAEGPARQTASYDAQTAAKPDKSEGEMSESITAETNFTEASNTEAGSTAAEEKEAEVFAEIENKSSEPVLSQPDNDTASDNQESPGTQVVLGSIVTFTILGGAVAVRPSWILRAVKTVAKYLSK